jgi:hypothetical protein
MKEQQFIGVSFGVIKDRVCAVAVSDGISLASSQGESLSSADVLTFLWFICKSFSTNSNRNVKLLPVMFDAAVDLELLFQDLSKSQKDIFYHLIAQMEEDNIQQGNPLADKPNRIIDHSGFQLSCLPGRLLTVGKDKQVKLVISDLGSFFEGQTLAEVAESLEIKTEIQAIEKNEHPLWTQPLIRELGKRCIAEAKTIALIADRVKATLEPLDINLRSWYGPAAVASHCLNKWGARKQAKRLKENNAPSELLKAIDIAYIGGRVELLKLGTLKDIRTFDLNSAYAYATTLLSQFYSPLRFTRRYDKDCPFSCWLVDYELPGDVTLGVLPTRSTKGQISFGLKGRGYFWQPEVDYLRQRYPGSYSVQWGYVTPNYKQVTFAAEIQKMYDYRCVLKKKGDNAEKVIKLALANLYGKFAQNKGSAFYQCRAWAGWITSLVRRLMLEAVTGNEDRTICFCQDAIHLAGAEAKAQVGDGLGEWKRDQFAQGLYVAPGFYILSGGEDRIKRASRGANSGLDFAKIATDLSNRQVSELSRQFFVGWQMARQAPVRYKQDYLKEVVESFSLVPSRMQSRTYATEMNWHSEHKDSQINRYWSGLMSARYRPNDSVSNGLRLRLKDRESQWR